MDRREEIQSDRNRYKKELEEQRDQEIDFSKQYIEENGNKIRVPYRTVKKIVFLDVSQTELRDIEHAARLQYRLMLQDAVLKATINFTKKTITVIFNPDDADNLKEKTNPDNIMAFLAEQGVHVDRSMMKEEDYDYLNNLYNYAFNPPSIREHPPYGYTKAEWEKIKPEWEAKSAKATKEKLEKFRKFQENYDAKIWAQQNPEAAAAKAEEERKSKSLMHRIFGGKKKQGDKGDKEFWFHGI